MWAGGYKPDKDGSLLSGIALAWMMREAKPHRYAAPVAATIYRSKRPFYRSIDHGKGRVLIHKSVKQRWDQGLTYRPKNLVEYIDQHGWPSGLVS